MKNNVLEINMSRFFIDRLLKQINDLVTQRLHNGDRI